MSNSYAAIAEQQQYNRSKQLHHDNRLEVRQSHQSVKKDKGLGIESIPPLPEEQKKKE